MATRHLYELEDVAATLLHAIQTAQHALAFQAARELHRSGEDARAFRLLTLAWMLSDPSSPFQPHRCAAFRMGDPFPLLRSLLTSDTVEALPELCDIHDMPPRPVASQSQSQSQSHLGWTVYPASWTPAEAERLWRAVTYAMRHGFWQHAAYLLRPLLTTDKPSLAALLRAIDTEAKLIDLLERTEYAPLSERILQHALSALVIPYTVDVPIHTYTPAQWNSSTHIGTRKGRTFTVDPQALALWGLHSTPLSRLMGAPVLVAEESASAFWRQEMARYGCRCEHDALVFDNDDDCTKQDAFYVSLFPDDIPDEWSNTERLKSHGVSVTTSVENPWRAAFHAATGLRITEKP